MSLAEGQGGRPVMGQLLRTADVLALVRVTDSTLRSWIKAGRFPAPTGNLGRSPVWGVEVVERWVESQSLAVAN